MACYGKSTSWAWGALAAALCTMAADSLPARAAETAAAPATTPAAAPSPATAPASSAAASPKAGTTAAGDATLPAAPVTGGVGNPFDPKSYIDQEETKAQEASSSLSARAIYRINGQRYQMFQAGPSSVWLPSIGGTPEIRKESALCEEHLKLMREVLPLREELPLDPEVKKHETQIVDLIRMCREGLIKSPVLTQTRPDGAVVEIKAREAGDSDVQGPESEEAKNGGRPAGVEASFRTPGGGGK